MRNVGVITDLENTRDNFKLMIYKNTKTYTLNLATIKLMKKHKRIQLPLIGNDNKVVKILNINSLTEIEKKDNLIFIFAGGVGKRLNPYTFKKPKPMLSIGNKPMLENLIMNFKKQGFYRFCIAVNYKKDQIINYFKDGKTLTLKFNILLRKNL